MSEPEVVVVGGGLAGLCCARRLHEAGVPFLLLEASDEVGGRARTDVVDGFLLDRGFQVLLTAYPEAQAVLDYDALNLAKFSPGALVRHNGKFHRFVDPWRSPKHLLSTALSPVGSTFDKLRMAKLRSRVCKGDLEDVFQRPARTTLATLQDDGFSTAVIDQFFRPFLGGIFLDPALETSSRMFEFVFRMFATGLAAIPADGMGAMAQQLAAGLPAGSIRTSAPVDSIRADGVTLASGETIATGNVVVACEAPAAARLLGEATVPTGQSVTCLYFSADQSPVAEPILVLNGEGTGPVNNLCVPSEVSSTYAPAGKSLVSVSVLGEAADDIETQVRDQLRDWYGAGVDTWQHLKTYNITYALPSQQPPALQPVSKPARREDGLFACGDWLDTASIQGAMVSGRRAADAVLKQRTP